MDITTTNSKQIFHAKRSLVLYYGGRIISILNKEKACDFCFIMWHQHQTRSGKIKANKIQQMSVKTQVFL